MELIMRRLLAGKNQLISNDILIYFGYDYGTDVCYYILLGMLGGYTILGWIAICLKARTL